MDAGVKKKRNPNPRITANILSLVTFGWVLEIFKKGYKNDLEVEDLYETLDEHRSGFLGDELESLWEKELNLASAKNKEPSLFKVLVRCHGPYILFLQMVMCFIELCLVMTQPLYMGGLIRYFEPGSDMSHETAIGYAACIIACSTLNVFISHAHNLGVFHIGMKIRVGLCSLIYRKALRLSKTALGETTVGQTVNLLSNDVSRFDVFLLFLAFIWIGPVEMVIVVYLMWQQIEIAVISGVAVVVLVIPFQVFCGKMISTLRMRTAKRTDQRIRFMNEIIVGIQVIKMYAWEKPFAHLVSLARKREIQAVRASAFLQGFLLSFGWIMGRKFAIFASVVTYALLGNNITPEKVFVVAAYFNILTESMTSYVSLAIAHFAEAYTSIKRIKTFLLYDEIAHAGNLNVRSGKVPIADVGNKEDSKNVLSNGSVTVITTLKETKPVPETSGGITDVQTGNDQSNVENLCCFSGEIRVTNATAKWTKDVSDKTLTDVCLDIAPEGLLAIIGPVGSGKTSLLHAILKELPLTGGSISVEGSVSYASQEPWLFTGSVRQNILFGQPMNRDRYRKVVRACALQRDFQLLQHGDRTIVGERGVTVSGGQRARINLARAIYKEADIYLLDDPLSAVDTHVGRHLFDDCICDFLQGKTRVLVTHQLQYLQTADNIVIINNGAVEAKGTFTELQESGVDFAKQLAVDSEEHEKKEESSSGSVKSIMPVRVRQISETSTISSMSQSEPEVLAEMRTRGSVSSSVYRSYCAAGGNCGVTFLVFSMFVIGQISVSAGDYWMSYWSNVEEQRIADKPENVTLQINSSTSLPFGYNSTTNLTAINSTETEWLPSTNTCIYVYTGLVIAIVVLETTSILFFFSMCMRASINLHNSMFSSITRATMWFFNSNPSGQILNRFSKDMGSVDEFIPHTMLDCVQIGLAVLGVVLVVAVVNFWLMIPTAVMFAFFYLLRVYYVSTSRSIKRLEGITRSPVFSHLSASLQGMTTIRAFGAEDLLKQEFDGHQDLHSSAWFMFIASSRAFAVWLDSACLVYIALVTISFLFVGSGQYGGDVGLAITQAIGLIGMIQWGMRQSAEMENSMTSLERVLEYTGVESEPPLESPPDKKPPENWPFEGAIEFNRVFLAYSKDDSPVLKNVTFTVKPSEKIGIVGRTGAGKSSLISALFRLVDPSGGLIRIDGVDTFMIGLHDLRSKISIIPQEPALFSGTLRDNLDPFDQYPDGALWAALAEVELKQAVDELPAGLSHKVSEGGSNFSVGQRQLLCLARAIVRNNKILVLDEATANVDPQTDELIQTTIRTKFADCTVLTIAHRLHTVMDSDRILVMDAGTVVEFDQPHTLLQNKNGVLYQMVEQTGRTMAGSLFKVAQSCYKKGLEESKEKKL